MTLSISIDPDPHGSDSYSDDEGSSGVHVSASSELESHEYLDHDEWAHLPYPDELKPSDSASRPRTSNRSRPPHGSRSASGRRPPSRRMAEHQSFAPRGRRQQSPDSPDSADSDEYPSNFGRNGRGWQQPIPPGYAPSQSSGPSYPPYPPAPPPGHAPYAHHNPPPITSELMRIAHPGQPNPYGAPPYGYPPQFQPGPHFLPDQPQLHRHAPRQPPQMHNPMQPPMPPMPHAMGPHGAHPAYPGYPQELMAYVDTAKDEQIARLEKLILDDRNDREAKELAKKQAIERAAAEKAAQDAQTAHDRKITLEAAALARADAEKKAAEDAAKAKEEAEKATAAAASEAAAAATAAANDAAAKAAAAAAEAAAKAAEPPPPPPPPEKKQPIKFKDAVGRKFSFPFELCATWKGMEELIRQAFLHIEVIGPHVAEGHYDLVGPNGDIILPQVWETVVEPDWAITMHMWPIPEKPKEDPPPAPEPAPVKPADPPAEPKKKADGPKKAKARGPDVPGSFAMWMLGGTNRRGGKGGPKVEKKPDAPPPAPAPAP
ncbi:hypothetical protein N7517_004126 [Penicillium concentricum]|uniref:Ubiquitin-like domain-containing protein n=1 Tax=Penicillium concentricum TaxID=293559 RepID=A0A9W9S6A3_9EURO|nr:uncharacterized protein N7517_004126 [Penicillium concentricum]KAJ5372120.1 hypothetical protein N7517_004126 [Penicillium concentricum]